MADHVTAAMLAFTPGPPVTLVQNASGEVFAPDDLDYATPLTVELLDGTQVTTILSTDMGFIPPLRLPMPMVIWKSGPYTVPVVAIPTEGGASALADLTDVAVAGATAGQALVFDGAEWAPGAAGVDPNTYPRYVAVVTGNEARPGGFGMVIWVGGTTQPVNMASGDLWLQEGAPSAPDTTAPTVPTGVMVTAQTTTELTIAWNASTDNVGVTGYEVRLNSGTPVATAGLTYTFTGLTSATTYGAQVRARDLAGNWSGWSATLNVTTSTANTNALVYADRAAFLASGWSFLARTAGGSDRDTEQSGQVDYDPTGLQIPANSGDIWGAANDSHNTAFRSLNASWTQVELSVTFTPIADWDLAGFAIYQDDDNYVAMSTNFSSSWNLALIREVAAAPTIVQSAAMATASLRLRLARSGTTYTAGYSVNGGTSWTTLGTTTATLTNPRIALMAGGYTGGTFSSRIATFHELIVTV